MKTYSVRLSAEKALPILESEREEVALRLAELDTDIAKIRDELGIEENTTNGHVARKRTRSVVSATVYEGIKHLNGVLDEAISNGIKKTATGRSAKGETETSILEYLKTSEHAVMPTLALAKALEANYSTTYRSLKKLEEQGLVRFADGFWRRTDKLRGLAQ